MLAAESSRKPVTPVDDPINTGRKSGSNTWSKLADVLYFRNGEVLMAVITTRSALASTIYLREFDLAYVKRTRDINSGDKCAKIS
jgi:hypothetical protein